MVLFYTNFHFQYISVPFERIFLINFFSLVLPWGWGFRAFSARECEFLPQGFAAFFAQGVGILPPKKDSRGLARGGGGGGC